ncbi:MAG: alpha/beta hydrolase [Pedobacter sp.]|nr:alpha/beta hydrolase [Pedobacter sp.]
MQGQTLPLSAPDKIRPPRLHYHDNALNRDIVSALSQLQQPFRPTPWLFNSHLQMALANMRGGKVERDYDHHDTLTMADGGHTALAWRGYRLPADTPTVVILHTIGGSPASMAELVRDVQAATGWRIALCVRRGHAGLPLPVPRINILGSTDDLREQLAVIRQRFPDSPLYAIGSSAGSGLLVRFLGEEGNASPFRASFAYCPGYNTDEAFEKAHPFYSRYIVKKLVQRFVEPHAEKIAHLPTLASLRKAESLAEFHRHMYEFSGYSSYEAYSQASNPMRVFDRITTPVMILNSEDDLICRIDNVTPYLDAMRSMPNVILVTTEKGSHCAHYEGWRARSWSGRLMGSYFLTMHKHSAA